MCWLGKTKWYQREKWNQRNVEVWNLKDRRSHTHVFNLSSSPTPYTSGARTLQVQMHTLILRQTYKKYWIFFLDSNLLVALTVCLNYSYVIHFSEDDFFFYLSCRVVSYSSIALNEGLAGVAWHTAWHRMLWLVHPGEIMWVSRKWCRIWRKVNCRSCACNNIISNM